MPAAAVIPAPRAYINVVAFKKPVVGFEALSVAGYTTICFGRWLGWQPHNDKCLRHAGSYTAGRLAPSGAGLPATQRRVHTPEGAPAAVTVSKPECSRQPTIVWLNVQAWNDKGPTPDGVFLLVF